MKQFLLLHAHYDPDNYVGHRVVDIKAEDFEAAKKQANDLLERRCSSSPWEYQLVEVAQDSGYRIHEKDKQSWLVGGKY